MTGPTNGAAELENALIGLELDALPAYDSAKNHLSQERDRHEIEAFLRSHRRHVVELSQLVVARGQVPTTRGDVRQLLEKGKVALGAIAGEQAVLIALKSNADDLVTAYQRAMTDASLDADERAVIERCLEDEQAHSKWLVERIGITPVVGEAIMAKEGENIRAERSSREP